MPKKKNSQKHKKKESSVSLVLDQQKKEFEQLTITVENHFQVLVDKTKTYVIPGVKDFSPQTVNPALTNFLARVSIIKKNDKESFILYADKKPVNQNIEIQAAQSVESFFKTLLFYANSLQPDQIFIYLYEHIECFTKNDLELHKYTLCLANRFLETYDFNELDFVKFRILSLMVNIFKENNSIHEQYTYKIINLLEKISEKKSDNPWLNRIYNILKVYYISDLINNGKKIDNIRLITCIKNHLSTLLAISGQNAYPLLLKVFNSLIQSSLEDKSPIIDFITSFISLDDKIFNKNLYWLGFSYTVYKPCVDWLLIENVDAIKILNLLQKNSSLSKKENKRALLAEKKISSYKELNNCLRQVTKLIEVISQKLNDQLTTTEFPETQTMLKEMLRVYHELNYSILNASEIPSIDIDRLEIWAREIIALNNEPLNEQPFDLHNDYVEEEPKKPHPPIKQVNSIKEKPYKKYQASNKKTTSQVQKKSPTPIRTFPNSKPSQKTTIKKEIWEDVFNDPATIELYKQVLINIRKRSLKKAVNSLEKIYSYVLKNKLQLAQAYVFLSQIEILMLQSVSLISHNKTIKSDYPQEIEALFNNIDNIITSYAPTPKEVEILKNIKSNTDILKNNFFKDHEHKKDPLIEESKKNGRECSRNQSQSK